LFCSAAVFASLDFFAGASLHGVEVEHDVPNPSNKDTVGEAHPDVEPHPVLPDPSGGVLLLGAAHVAEARELSHEDDGEDEKEGGVATSESNLVEA
jgi:hypothetical protein